VGLDEGRILAIGFRIGSAASQRRAVAMLLTITHILSERVEFASSILGRV
jgi:hypothetical protein